jgi:hypothetical protein
MVARVTDCCDHDAHYGILTVENVSIEEVQNKIYEIKNRFYEEDFDDWCIDDVLEQFPEEWEWDWVQTDDDDILEI